MPIENSKECYSLTSGHSPPGNSLQEIGLDRYSGLDELLNENGDGFVIQLQDSLFQVMTELAYSGNASPKVVSDLNMTFRLLSLLR